MSSVDVIVPCYRYGHYLRECVTSVLKQSIPELRVLIINDASPDDTTEVATHLLKEDPRVTYLQHATNKGHIFTYNEGIEWASADYLLLLSADDYLLPGGLRCATDLMDAHPEVGFTFGNVIELDETGTATEVRNYLNEDNEKDWRILKGLEFIELSAQHNIVRTPTAVVRTGLQKSLGGYRPELPHTGDMEMWLRFAAYSSVGMLERYQAVYRRHCTNMSSGYMVNCWLPDLKQRKAALDCFFQTCSEVLPNVTEIRGRLFRSLASDAVRFASTAFNEGDLSLSEQLSSFALAVCPDIKQSSSWKKFSCKRFVGSRVWTVVRPVVAKARKSVLKSKSTMASAAESPVCGRAPSSRETKSVLFVTRSFEYGGAEKHLIALINSFGRSPVKLSMFCLQEDFHFYTRRLNQNGTHQVDIKCMLQLDACRGLKSTIAWLRALRHARPDAVVFVYGSFWALPWHVSIAAWLAGIPRRFAIAHLAPPPPPAKARSFRRTMYSMRRIRHLLGVRLASLCYTTIISVSTAVRDALIRDYNYPSSRVVTVHNGVFVSEFSRNDGRGLTVRTSIGCTPEEFLLVCVARLNEHKRIDILLSALARLLREGVRVKCVIVGDGPLRSQLVEQARTLKLSGYVVFEGFKEDIYPYLQAANAFVLTSSKEGFALAILEAMACGLPCVVTNVGGNAEAITDKVHGLLVSPESVNEVADAISYLINHPEERARMSELAKRRARDSFRWEGKLAEIRNIVLG